MLSKRAFRISTFLKTGVVIEHTEGVSLPWRLIVLTGIVFFLGLWGVNNFQTVQPPWAQFVWAGIRFLMFSKADWLSYVAGGALVVVLVCLFPATTKSRSRIGGFLRFFFNGLVGCYLGIALWNFSISQPMDGVDFLCWAWVTYVWFFLALNVIEQGIPPKQT